MFGLCGFAVLSIIILCAEGVTKQCDNSAIYLPCQCLEKDSGEKLLYCDDNDIVKIYKVFDSFPENTTLAKVDIYTKSRYLRKSLTGKAKARQIKLNVRGLKSVHSDALAGHETSLEWFQLSNTQLSSVPTRLLRKLKILTTFICEKSKATEVIPEDGFEGFKSALTIFDLNYAYNSISTLEKGAFSHLLNLKIVVLTGNKIKKIKLHSFPANMEMLKKFFFGKNGMEKLPFDQNFIEAIPRNSLINLSKNKLANIHSDFLRQMIIKGTTVLLQGNKLVCDCNFMTVVAANKNHIGHLFQGECSKPDYLKDKNLKDLTKWEFPKTCKINEKDLVAVMQLTLSF